MSLTWTFCFVLWLIRLVHTCTRQKSDNYNNNKLSCNGYWFQACYWLPLKQVAAEKFPEHTSSKTLKPWMIMKPWSLFQTLSLSLFSPFQIRCWNHRYLNIIITSLCTFLLYDSDSKSHLTLNCALNVSQCNSPIV